jgi:hypothetical protein
MNFEIKSRFNGKILFSLETESLKLCVEVAVKSRANLNRANLSGADLNRANLTGAFLTDANLSGAFLTRANLTGAFLTRADLNRANLTGAFLTRANLTGADLADADLAGANLAGATLTRAFLTRANLTGAKNMVKIMGVEPGNYYWKRFDECLNNQGYKYYVGLNELRKGEVFADDERIVCSYPGFHFASRSWCAANYPSRPLEARIQIPLDAKINEPWATDGKASADKIIVLQVFEAATGKDVTDKYQRPEGL